jgi:hypothetical protein
MSIVFPRSFESPLPVNTASTFFSTEGVEFVDAQTLKRYAAVTSTGDELEEWFTATVETLGARLPVPPSIDDFRINSFYRIANHRRSCCLSRVNASGHVCGPVIVMKGLEVLSPNIESFLQRLSREYTGRFRLRAIELFPIIEQKAPMALTVDEAVREADIAQEIHDHFMVPTKPLRLPRPIAIHRIGEREHARYLAAVRRATSFDTFSAVEKIAREGLCIYSYAYPAVPLRLFNIDGRELKRSLDSHLGYLRTVSEPAEVVASWCYQVACLLAMNILPTSLLSKFTGSCVDENNVVLDGGFVDLGSCARIDAAMTDSFVLESVEITLVTLAGSILKYFSRFSRVTEECLATGRSVERYCFNTVGAFLFSLSEGRQCVDARLLRYFSTSRDLDRLLASLDIFISSEFRA